MSFLKRILVEVLACFIVGTQILHAAVITFSPGIAYENNGRTQTVLLETNPQILSNQYVANTNWSNTFSAQLFLGTDVYKQTYLNTYLGLTLDFVDDIRMNGIVNQFALPGFDNFDYQYNVQSLSVMVTLKTQFMVDEHWQPYVDGSIGVANNNATHYQETSRIIGAVPMSPFSDGHTNSFAYSVGTGLMYSINQQISIGLGYQFSDLGSAKLDVFPGQQTSQTPTLNHLFLQQLLFHLSWCR